MLEEGNPATPMMVIAAEMVSDVPPHTAESDDAAKIGNSG